MASDGLSLDQGPPALVEHASERDRADADWGLLVIEFRGHAARNPDLNRRYGEMNERTVAGVAGVVARIYDHAGEALALPAPDLARLLLTVAAGVRLEQATSSEVLPNAVVEELLARVPTALVAASGVETSKRRKVA